MKKTPPSLNVKNMTAKPPPFQLPGVPPLLQNAWYHDPYAYLTPTVKKRKRKKRKGKKERTGGWVGGRPKEKLLYNA
jgi:hypothetical protein